ncbi:hypothetical protein [Thiohalobacter sp.]|uniref:hypothetical protein n=1 Tax=Thiohalobacter sp. TaxID=2025948 RepID=UPI00261AC6FF|nr:hypothetical protein [Thiohalobacter sp.]
MNASTGGHPARNAIPDHGSLLSHLAYGLGTAAVLALPLLLPGMDMPHLMIDYEAVAVGVYVLACVAAVVQALRPGSRNRGRR